MSLSLQPSLLNTTTTTFKLASPPLPTTYFSFNFSSSTSNSSYRSLKFPAKIPHSLAPQNDTVPLSDFQDLPLGDCLVLDDSAFENSHVTSTFFDQNTETVEPVKPIKKKKKTKKPPINNVSEENLVPEQWRMIQEEINLTKKEKRKIAQEIEFGSKVEQKKVGYKPLRSINLQEYLEYKKAKLAELNPVKLDNPTSFRVDGDVDSEVELVERSSERVAGKNPKWAVYGRGLEDVANFFNSEKYVSPDKKTEGNGLVLVYLMKAYLEFLRVCA